MGELLVTVYGGAAGDGESGEIGGNRICVEWDEQRWFFDFGARFKRAARFYEEFLRPRAAVGLRDYLRMGLLPPLEGLYRDDLWAHEPDLWDRYRDHPQHRRLEAVDGVLVSHAHLDHTGALGFLRADVPVFTGLTTAVTSKAIQDVRGGGFESELCYLAPRAAAEGVLKAHRSGRRQRRYVVCEQVSVDPQLAAFWRRPPGTRTELEACPLEVWDPSVHPGLRFWRVDHSVPGSGAFGLRTPAGWVVYTGDLRRHGFSARRVERFVAEAAALRPALLVVEGTRVREASSIGEPEVYEAVDGVVASTEGLVIGDFGPRNIERLRTFHDVARSRDRRLVVTAVDAYLLEQLHRVDPNIPAPWSESICVLREPVVSEKVWMRELYDRLGPNLLSAADVRRDPGSYVACLSFWDIANLIDIDPQGGAYIYSSSEAYTEEQAIDHQRLVRWLEHFGLKRFGGLPGCEAGPFHASGHADGPCIEWLVEEIAPERILPVHTEDLGWFLERWPGRVVSYRYGVPVAVA